MRALYRLDPRILRHYLSSSRSWEFTTTYAPHGANIDNAAVIKQNVSVPVAVVGGINSPEMAEQAIASGKVDMVSMGRSFLPIRNSQTRRWRDVPTKSGVV